MMYLENLKRQQEALNAKKAKIGEKGPKVRFHRNNLTQNEDSHQLSNRKKNVSKKLSVIDHH